MLFTGLKISRFTKLSGSFAFVVLAFLVLSVNSFADVHNRNTTLTTSPSGTVNIIVSESSGYGYFDAKISGLGLDGTYSAFCISPFVPILSTYTYVSEVKSSYDLSSIPVNNTQNLDLVNYILNQDFIGKDSGIDGLFTYGDVQVAIWRLLCDAFIDDQLGEWSIARAQLIIEAAQNGKGYIPQPGDYMAIVLINPYSMDVFDTFNNYGDGQPFIIMVPVQCKTSDDRCSQGHDKETNQGHNQGSSQGCNKVHDQGSNQGHNQGSSQRHSSACRK